MASVFSNETCSKDVAVATNLVNKMKELEQKLAEMQDYVEKLRLEYISKRESQANLSSTSSSSDAYVMTSTSTEEEKKLESENFSKQLNDINELEFVGLMNSVENETKDENESKDNIETYKNAGQKSEWTTPRVIITHEPGNEIEIGLCHPQAALYEKPFDSIKCTKEHRNMRSEIEKTSGCQTLTISEILINMVDKKKLGEFAMSSMEYDLTSIEDIKERKEEIVKQEKYMKNLMGQLSSKSLTQIIMMRPKVLLKRDNKNTYFLADYQVSPLMNLLFMRDPLIVTKKGVVILAMNSKQRNDETKLMRFVIEQLGYEILLDVNQESEKLEAEKSTNDKVVLPRVEGGDFIACGEYAMIGQGLRTNFEAIKIMMDNDVFGTKYVVIVKDEWKNQQEMHLDTYFNIAGPHVCVMSEWRKNGIKNNGEKYNTLVDMYSLDKNSGKYNKTISNYDFYEFLQNKLEFKIVLASEEDQAKYGINFVCVGDNKIIGVKGASDKYVNALRDTGVDAKWIDISAMQCAYGAIHCTTQPVVRSYK